MRRGGATGGLEGTTPVGEEIPRVGEFWVFSSGTEWQTTTKKLTSFQCLNPDAMSYEIINMR